LFATFPPRCVIKPQQRQQLSSKMFLPVTIALLIPLAFGCLPIGPGTGDGQLQPCNCWIPRKW
jgi:hypothetical protein